MGTARQTEAGQEVALRECIRQLGPTPDEADYEPLRAWFKNNASSKRGVEWGGWGPGPTEFNWVISALIGGIIGNFGYDVLKAAVKNIARKWRTPTDPSEWLRKLASADEYEELRLVRHADRPALMSADKRFEEHLEGRLIVLRVQAASFYEGEELPWPSDARLELLKVKKVERRLLDSTAARKPAAPVKPRTRKKPAHDANSTIPKRTRKAPSKGKKTPTDMKRASGDEGDSRRSRRQKGGSKGRRP